MYGFGSYVVAGLALVLAFEYTAPADASLAYRDVGSSVAIYQVNRTGKGDRLVPSQASIEKKTPVRSPKILAGCDAAFSNLSAYAKLNYASRCIS